MYPIYPLVEDSWMRLKLRASTPMINSPALAHPMVFCTSMVTYKYKSSKIIFPLAFRIPSCAVWSQTPKHLPTPYRESTGQRRNQVIRWATERRKSFGVRTSRLLNNCKWKTAVSHVYKCWKWLFPRTNIYFTRTWKQAWCLRNDIYMELYRKLDKSGEIINYSKQ